MKYLPIVLLIFILLLPAMTLLTIRKEIGLKQTNEGKVLFFSGSGEFKFSFISPKDNLNSVVLKLKNISIRNSKPVYFYLLEDQERKRQIKINGSNIGDSSMVRFAFADINDSKNKKYTVILNSPETKKDDELGIHTDFSNNPVILTYHTPSSRFQLILDTYKNLGRKIFADKIFILIWLIFLGLPTYILLTHRFRKYF